MKRLVYLNFVDCSSHTKLIKIQSPRFYDMLDAAPFQQLAFTPFQQLTFAQYNQATLLLN